MEVGEDQAHHRPHRRHSSIVVANLEALEAAGLISIVQPLQEQIWRKEEADQGRRRSSVSFSASSLCVCIKQACQRHEAPSRWVILGSNSCIHESGQEDPKWFWCLKTNKRERERELHCPGSDFYFWDWGSIRWWSEKLGSTSVAQFVCLICSSPSP
jgi:hypothetical protein